MKTHIIYFSRTGDTKNLAVSLSKNTAVPAFELTDDIKWYGPIGFIKGFWYSAVNKTMKLHLDQSALEADRLVVMSPVWLGGPAPAVKTLLESITNKPVILVMLNHSSPIEGVLKKYKNKYNNITQTYGITHTKNNEQSILNQLTETLAQPN